MKSILRVVFLLCFAAVSACGGGSLSVHDGDTFHRDGRAYRLWGIDAPELDQPWGVASREPERRTAGEHFSKQKPIRVDTGENFLNRNRGCADLLLYGPIIVVILAVICYVLDALFG